MKIERVTYLALYILQTLHCFFVMLRFACVFARFVMKSTCCDYLGVIAFAIHFVTAAASVWLENIVNLSDYL